MRSSPRPPIQRHQQKVFDKCIDAIVVGEIEVAKLLAGELRPPFEFSALNDIRAYELIEELVRSGKLQTAFNKTDKEIITQPVLRAVRKRIRGLLNERKK